MPKPSPRRRAPKTVTLPKPDATLLAETVEPLSRRPLRTALRWGVTLLLLGAALWWLRQPALRLWEARKWKRLVAEDFHSATSVDVRWQGRPYHFVSEGGPLRLQMDFPLTLREGFTRQPFDLELDLQAIAPASEARLTVLAASQLQTFEQPAPSGGVRTWARWAGLFAELDQRGGFLHGRVGRRGLGGDEADLALATLALPRPASVRRLRLRYDGDVLALSLDDEPLASSLVRSLPLGGDGRFRLGLAGANMAVTRFQARVPRFSESQGVLSAADEARLAGKLDLALALYSDLARRADRPDRAARLNYKKALVLAEDGRKDEARGLLVRLAEQEEGGLYPGYAAYDLAEEGLERARAAGAKGQRDQARSFAEAALRRLRALRAALPGHPVQPKADWLELALLAGPLAKPAEARGQAHRMLGHRAHPYAQAALELLRGLPGGREEDLALYTRLTEAGRGAAGAAYEGALLERVALLGRLGKPKEFFTALEKGLADPALSREERERLFGLAEQQARQAAFRLEAEAWAGRLEAERLAAGHLYRDFLRTTGLRFFRPLSDFRARGPLAERAITFLTRALALPKQAAPPGPVYFHKSDPAYAHSWGDSPQRQPTLGPDGNLLFDYDSGAYYGCGLNLFPNHGGLREGKYAQLSGARAMEVRLKAPPGAAWYASISEAGVGPVSAGEYAGVDGADGEQYLFERRLGTGAWETALIPLDQLRPNAHWGNQQGNFTLDLQAIQQVDVALLQGQGRGQLRLGGIRFVP